MIAKYCIDSSVLINGWRKHYLQEVFPWVWESLGNAIDEGVAVVPWEVYKEVIVGADDLADWLESFRHLIDRPTAEEQAKIRMLMKQMPNIAAQGGPRNSADPWVVAMAMVKDCIVVTDEDPQEVAKTTKSPKITFICKQLGLKVYRPVELLRELQSR